MIAMRSALLWLAIISVGCSNQLDPQAEIQKWNAYFGSQKQACESGNLAACQAACRLSMEKRICSTVAAHVDLSDPAQRAWVEQCPTQVANEGAAACQAVTNAGQQANPSSVPQGVANGTPESQPTQGTLIPTKQVQQTIATPPPPAAKQNTIPNALDTPASGETNTVSTSGNTQLPPESLPSTGALPVEVVRVVIGRQRGSIKMCYEQQYLKNPNLSGKMEVSFTIGTTGRVISANTSKTTLNDPVMESCVLNVYRRMVFPAPTGGPVTFRYPYDFSSQ